jgi:hypothetical protein
MGIITNPISNIPKLEKSHTLGWALAWKNLLSASIDHKCTPQILNADTVYIDHGANFGGTLNLFGGANDELFKRINLVMSCKNIVSLDWDMPDYGEMLAKRIGAKSTSEYITKEWCEKVSQRCQTIASLKHQNLIGVKDITVGDSHTIAFAGRNNRIYRNDGATLFGSLKKGLSSLMRDTIPQGQVTFSFGSIDIRHHLLRHESSDIEGLIREYVKQGDAISSDALYATPVPVEFEERRIPQTGFYKKTPFFGSLQERKDLTNRFIDILNKESNGRIVMPPKEWYTMDPKTYAETYMESNSSFHIAPPYYRSNDWGQNTLFG